MKSIRLPLIVLLFSPIVSAADDTRSLIIVPPPPPYYSYLTVPLNNNGDSSTDNSKFFLGRLPNIGEAVEYVYVGQSPAGGMNFQLRVKQ